MIQKFEQYFDSLNESRKTIKIGKTYDATEDGLGDNVKVVKIVNYTEELINDLIKDRKIDKDTQIRKDWLNKPAYWLDCDGELNLINTEEFELYDLS